MASQASMLVLIALASHGADAATIRGASGALRNGEQMRPDVVANTLANVEEEWRKEAADFTDGAGSAGKAAPDAFAKSCSTVVSAVIQGSGGDRNVAREYMTKVCGQKVLAGWRGVRCTALATSITDHAMLADNYANRQNLNPMKVCSGFWSVFVQAEQNRAAEEAKDRAEKEKVRAELEKKASALEAEAKKKLEAAAKLEAERRAKDEARREQEEKEQKAKIDAAEAKARAAEAAARLAEKKAEAEKVQKEAQLKLEEAVSAEKEHQERQAEHQKAEENLRSATKAAPKSSKEVVAPPAAPKPAAAVTPATPVVAVAKEAKAVEKAPAEVKPVVANKVVEAPQKVKVAAKAATQSAKK